MTEILVMYSGIKNKLFLIVIFYISISYISTAQSTEPQILLYENFDGDQFPPLNWEKQSINSNSTWQQNENPRLPFNAIDPTSKHSALCPWSVNYQEEWLVSPEIIIPEGYKYLSISFFSGFNPSWLKTSNFCIFLINKNNEVESLLWKADSTILSTHVNADSITIANKRWSWFKSDFYIRNSRVSNNSDADTIKIGILNIGKNGDLVAIDNIKIIGGIQNYNTDILSFTLPTQTGKANIDNQKHTINCELGHGTDFSNLSPIISLSDTLATIDPKNGSNLSFKENEPFIYVVSAEDKNIQQAWTVTLTQAPVNKGVDIKSFKVPFQVGNEEINIQKGTVSLKVFEGTNLSNIIPTVKLSDSASISPVAGTPISFTKGKSIAFTVTAQDASTKKSWNVTITEAKGNDSDDITGFNIEGLIKSSLVIDKETKQVTCEVLYGTKLTQVLANIEVTDYATVTPNPIEEPVDYNKPVEFMLQSINPNKSPVKWTITVKVQDYLNEILTFSIQNQKSKTKIDNINHTISLTVGNDANFDTIKPIITYSSGAYGKYNIITNCVPGQSFVWPVIAANGTNIMDWNITIYKEPKSKFSENFDNDIFPPIGWHIDTTNTEKKTWTLSNNVALPFDTIDEKNVYSAFCPWSSQDSKEILTSSPIFIDGEVNFFLEFYAAFNKAFLDSANLYLLFKPQNSINKEWEVIFDATQGQYTSQFGTRWDWHNVKIDMTPYLAKYENNDSITLRWVYKGWRGDLVGIDNVILYEKEMTRTAINYIPDYEDITLFPNPASGFFTIKGVDSQNISIFDVNGKKVLQINEYFYPATINVSSLKKGFYIVKFSKYNNYNKLIIK